MASNQAAWLDGKAAKLRVGPADLPTPGADDIVLRNHAIAVNPVDWKIQDYGVFVQSWPFILGCDVAGEVTEVGSNVKSFKKGDRVIGHTVSLATQKAQNGGFQLYSAIDARKAAILPDSISYTDGVVIPLALDTAAVGLYLPSEDGFIGLPLPSLTPKPSGKVLVVWGGSSSVGALVIQLAVASGATVITTASSHNFVFCKKAGASEVFDHKSPSVDEDVAKAVKAAGGEFVGVYDAISTTGQSLDHVFAILEKLGGGNVATVLPPPEKLPGHVKAGNVFGVNPLTHPIWKDYVTPALEGGKLQCLPPPLVIGKGLESIQKGLDENKKGVSAKKVVVEL